MTLRMIQLLYISLFTSAAVACLFAIWRARTIANPATRTGLVGLLVTSAGWAGAQAARLLTTNPMVASALYLSGLVFGLAAVGAWLYFCSAYTGQSYHRSPTLRWTAFGLFASLTAIKLTNPLHQLYFTTQLVTTPFPHIVIGQLRLHWAVTVLAYALTAIGFYMLFQLFTDSQIPTTDLSILVSLTALPVIFDVLGFLSIPWILKLNYEPLGVAAFALGVLYVTEDTFEQVRWTGNRQVLDALDEAVIVVDEEYVIQDYNDTTTALFPELTASAERAFPEALPAIGQAVVEQTTSDETSETTIAYETSTGTEYYLLSITELTIGPHEVGYAVVCTDVTELVRQRQSLENQTEQLDGFAAAITHELRNTLAIANGNLEIIGDAIEHGERAVAMDALTTVEESTDRMTTIVSELATMARLGQPAEELTEVRFDAVMRRLWDIVEPGDVDLRIMGDGTIDADEERLEELLRNVGQLASATGATELVVELRETGIVLTTDGDRVEEDTGDAFFRYGMAVPTAETGMLGPNIQTLARAQNWDVTIETSYQDGIKLEITDVTVEL